jgi:hypothetical protein
MSGEGWGGARAVFDLRQRGFFEGRDSFFEGGGGGRRGGECGRRRQCEDHNKSMYFVHFDEGQERYIQEKWMGMHVVNILF